MKILMLGWELPPHNSGGMGVACFELCKALAKRKVDIDFLIPFEGDYDDSFMKIRTAFPIHFNETEDHYSTYDGYKFLRKDGHVEWYDVHGHQQIYEMAAAQLAEVLDFDIIHAHDWLTCRAAIRAKEVSGKPLFVQFHSVESDRAGGNGGNPYIREIEEIAVNLADRVIAVSQKTKDKIVAEYGVPANKVEVVHNSINASEFIIEDYTKNSYAYLSKMQEQGYRVVVNVGRLTIQKGLPNLLRAAREVINRCPKTIFLFVGVGEMYYELIDLAASLGISKNVVFTGYERGKHWRDSYKIGNLFVMPSVSEPFGLTALEAAGYHTPTLNSKQSGVTEVFLNCLKVDYWDINEMANQICAVVKNDTLGCELAKNAYNELQTFCWTKSAEKLIDIYNRHMEMAQA